MTWVTKKTATWTLSALVCGALLTQTWHAMKWVFTSTLPPPSHASPPTTTQHKKHYKGDYTILAAYSMILFTCYTLFLIQTHFRFFSPVLITNSNDDEALKLPKSRHGTLGLKCYLTWRRWWHYEWRILGTTCRLGDSLALLVLVAIHTLLTLWPPLYDLDDDLNNPFPKHRRISNRLAQMAIIDLALAVGLSVRTSAVWRVIGFPNSSTTLLWHRWFARLGIFGAVYHGCFQWSKHYYRHYVAKQQVALAVFTPFTTLDTTRIDYDLADRHGGMDAAWLASMTWWDLLVSSPYYYTGTLMALSVIVLCVGSHPLIREKWYKWFRLTHGIGFLGLVGFGFWHHWTFVLFFLAATGLWLLDVVTRWYSTRPVSLLALVPVSENVVKFQVRVKDASMGGATTRLLPGQFIYCSFSGSKWKDVWWSHPFSISRVDNAEKTESIETSESQILTFYIKANGKQTRRLYNVANTENDWPMIRMGTPLGYSRTTSHWTDSYELYPVVVLVAEGIGITPWVAVLQSLASGFCDNGLKNDQDDNDDYIKRRTNHVHLIWTVREATMIDPLAKDIESMMMSANDSNNKNEIKLQLDWHIYVTGFGTSHQHQQHYNDSDQVQQQDHMTPSSSFLRQQKYYQGRPDYDCLLESIRLQHEGDDVALGLCAHEDSIQLCGNLARSSRFNQGNTFWNVKSERFDL